MGFITPEMNVSKADSKSKKAISDALRNRLFEKITTPDGNGVPIEKTVAQAIGDKLIDIALFSESEKCASTAAKLILEYTEGKPSVQNDVEKVEIPAVVFNLTGELPSAIKDKAKLPEQDISEKVLVEIEDGESIEL